MILNNKFGKIFGPGMRAGGFMFFLFGILVLFGESSMHKIFVVLIGIALIATGMLVVFTTSGMLLDIDNRRIKKYNKYLFFFKQGKWVSIGDFKYITTMNFMMSQSTFSRSNRELKTSEMQYEVYILNENHSKKIMINYFKGLEKSIDYVKLIAPKLGYKYVKYSPPISAKTRARRKQKR